LRFWYLIKLELVAGLLALQLVAGLLALQKELNTTLGVY
jgi:hypothetical protein